MSPPSGSDAAPEVEAEDAATRARELFGGLEGVVDRAEPFYRHLHEHPELSGEERETAAQVAERLHAAGYEVTAGVGGHGVVGLLRNGQGPVVAMRGDMDALPVQEQTGLPYASRVTVTRPDGSTVGVMHACGHDVHTACLVGTAELLSSRRDRWRGTAMILAQPAEETFVGAPAMLADGLFTRFERPDVVLGQHDGTGRVGIVTHRAGPVHAAARNFRVTVHGRGVHGSAPHHGVDPVVIASTVVVQLQTIVSRESSPNEPTVVTVGSFHSGTRPNIIPPVAVLEITTRGTREDTMDRIQASLERIVRATCEAGRSPEPPTIERVELTFANVNDTAATRRVRAVHEVLFGDEVVEFPVVLTGSEDFAFYGMPGPGRYEEPAIPTCFWGIGSTATSVWDALPTGSYLERAAKVPGGHTPFFAPDPGPTLRRGIEAMTSAALAYLPSP